MNITTIDHWKQRAEAAEAKLSGPSYKRATRPSGLHAVPESQRAERYQAVSRQAEWGERASDTDRARDAAARRRPADPDRVFRVAHGVTVAAVLAAVAFVAAAGVVAFADWFVTVPDGPRRLATVALVAPVLVAACAWAWRKLW